MKKLLGLVLMYFVSSCCFALSMGDIQTASVPGNCVQANDTTSPSFCGDFKSVAMCHCVERGAGNEKQCEKMGMNGLYKAMMAEYTTLDNACTEQAKQSDGTTKENCLNDWNFYNSRCQ